MRVSPLWIVLTSFALTACTNGSNSSVPPTETIKAARLLGAQAKGAMLIALSSGATTAISAFPLEASGYTRPRWNISGSRTRLKLGHGFAVAADGSIYALSGSAGEEPILLHFAANASGNVAPVKALKFPRRVLNDFSNGLFVDEKERVWLTDGGDGIVSAYRVRGDKLDAVLSFRPRIASPYGLHVARPHGIFYDGDGHIYCVANYLDHGTNFVGVSEYDVTYGARARLVRSFYDPTMPFDVPPDAIAMDGSGYIYLANTLNHDGIWVYAPGWRTGPFAYDRVIGRGLRGFPTGYIASLAALADGTLYVAMGDSNLHASSIVVYPPGAAGAPKPERVIRNADFIQYPEGNFGTLLVIR